MINCNSTSHGNFQDKANYKQITCEDTVPESGCLSSDLFFCIGNPHGQPLVFGDSTPLGWVLPSSRGAKEEGMGLAGVVWVKPWGGSAHGSPFVPLVPNPAQGHLCPIHPQAPAVSLVQNSFWRGKSFTFRPETRRFLSSKAGAPSVDLSGAQINAHCMCRCILD